VVKLPALDAHRRGDVVDGRAAVLLVVVVADDRDAAGEEVAPVVDVERVARQRAAVGRRPAVDGREDVALERQVERRERLPELGALDAQAVVVGHAADERARGVIALDDQVGGQGVGIGHGFPHSCL